MALQGFVTSVVSVNTIGNLGTLDDAVVGAQASLISSSDAITGTGNAHQVTVFGSVFGGQTGILLGSTGTVANVIVVSSTGQVSSGSTTLYMRGMQGNVFNSGLISGPNWGIYMVGDSASSNFTVANHGTINALHSIGLQGSGKYTIRNYGSIEGSGTGLVASTSAEVRLINHGTLFGDVNLGDLGDKVVSYGTIVGSIRMGDGADQLFLRGGFSDSEGQSGQILLEEGNDFYSGYRSTASVIDIYGGDGHDTFVPGNADEHFDGSNGEDTLNLSVAKAGVTVTLGTNGDSYGFAGTDTVTNIEVVYGSRFADRISGSEEANILSGDAGADTLSGAGGEDILDGGVGVDRLAGGGGNDVFLFYEPKGPADVITDFSNVVGNNDVIHINAVSFGGGLVAGPVAPSQFRSGPGQVAQDADDRFLFDTTTKSLWFDVDGVGAAAAVKIADLQASATFSLADLTLV